jgi:hypothetical protein
MPKVDLKKDLKHLYRPSAKAVAVVEVPPMRFLMIDGTGNPNTAPEYAAAVEALYAVAYALKFAVKKGAGGVDYAVMPLEGLWWADDMRQFSVDKKDDWLWTMMIMQPEFVTAELFAAMLGEAQKKKGLPALSKIRFEVYPEGPAVQIMHLGPYAAEAPTVARLHDYVHAQDWRLAGKHHEIYLKDPRKSAPGKLETVVRQPFEK